MTLCVYLVIVLLVVTKLCDVLSTLKRIIHPKGETNPIARQMMIRVGTTKAIWLVFVLALIIIGIAGAVAISGSDMMKALFIVVGVAISIVQGTVIHCNWSGHENVITRRARVLHAGLLQFIRR
jgi:putative effector of murein hydrolase